MDQLSELSVHLFKPVLVASLMCAVSTGLGAALLVWFMKKPGPRLVESYALGSLVISLLTFLWGTAGWMGEYQRLTLLIPVTAVSAIGWIRYRSVLSWSCGDAIRKNILVVLMVGVLGCIIALFFNLSLKPPTMCDECNSHLPAAMEIIRTGKIEFLPYLNFNNFPQNAEMLFAWSMAYSEPSTSHLVNFSAYIFLILALVRLGGIVFSEKVGWLAALILSMHGGIKFNVVHANVDIWILFYISAALLCLVDGMKQRDRGGILLAGVFIGAAAGVKYTALIAAATMVPAVISIYIGRKWKDDSARNSKRIPTRTIIQALGLSVLTASPWYIRNVIWFGNPFFPFYSEYFHFLNGTWSDLAPDLIINQGDMLANFSRDQYIQSGKFLDILFRQITLWAAIPCGIWFVRRSPFILIAVVWTSLSWLFWQGPAGGITYYRYYIYLYTVNVLLIAHMIIFIYNLVPMGVLRKLLNSTILIFLIFAAGWMLNIVFTRLPPVTWQDKLDILRRENGCYDLVIKANKIIGRNGSAVGVCVEDGRLYAEFRLMGGSDAGYAGNYEIASHCSSPWELSRCLVEKYDTEYFMVQKILTAAWQPSGLEPVIELIGSPGFDEVFEEVATTREGSLYRVKHSWITKGGLVGGQR